MEAHPTGVISDCCFWVGGGVIQKVVDGSGGVSGGGCLVANDGVKCHKNRVVDSSDIV